MFCRSTLTAAAALLLGATSLAQATEEYHAGLKGGIHDEAIETILVPEAVSMPETVSWYLRADFGYGFMTNTDIETGATGVIDPEGVESWSFGFGRYLAPNWRFDITGDFRKDEPVYKRSGTFFESFQRVGDVRVASPVDPTQEIIVQDVITFRIETEGSETISFQNHTVLANLYYDFDKWNGFRPYVGGGLGMSIYEIETQRSVNYTNCTATAGPAIGPLLNCDIEQADIARASADRAEDNLAIGWAISATAGASFELRDGWLADVNYRATYSGANIVTVVGGVGDDIDIQSKLDQEIRFGLRYELY
ncbi:MAG: opacity family porin [Pseudomonadota bacterium]